MRSNRRARLASRGVLALAGVLALVGISLLSAPEASGATHLGALKLKPASGTRSTAIHVQTISSGQHQGCPKAATHVRGLVNGPGGWHKIAVIASTKKGVSTHHDFAVPFDATFRTIARRHGLTITAGRYTVSVICQNASGSKVFGSFVTPIFFVDARHYQSTKPAAATTTSLSVHPAAPQPVGTKLTFTAALAPAAAVGTVRFKEGTTVLGGPVAVSGGTASFATSALAAGSHSVVATFTPKDSGIFTRSTSSAISVIVGAVPTTTVFVPSQPGGPEANVKWSVTVTPAAATGTVVVTRGAGTVVGTAQVTAGSATVSAAQPPGSATYTVSFVPTDPAKYAASTSPPVTFVVQ